MRIERFINRRSKSRRVAVSAAAVLTAILLAGCAKAGNSDANKSVAPEAATSTVGVSTVKYIDAGATCLCSFSTINALTQGYFTQEGLTLDNQSSVFNANQIVQAVAQGQADIALTGGSGPLAGMAAGLSTKVVAIVASPAPLQVTLNNDTLTKLAKDGVTPTSKYADKIKALKGLNIASAATGSTTDLLFRSALTTASISPDKDVTIQPFSDAAAGSAAVRQGAANGVVGFPLQTTQPDADGWGKIFIDFTADAPDVANIPYIVVAVNPTFLQNNPGTVHKFLNAMEKSRKDAQNFGTDKAAALKKSNFPAATDASYNLALKPITASFSRSIIPDQTSTANLLKVYNIGRTTPVDVKFGDLYDTVISSAVEGK